MVNPTSLFVLGGSGFIGRALIREAVAAGWSVKALARSESSARAVREAGADAVVGDAQHPERWIAQVAGTAAVVDLVQPPRSKRTSRSDMRRISADRQRFTQAFLTEFTRIDAANRPRFISVSGIDDLLAKREYGFNSIGIPVRRMIEAARIDASFVYLGVVYGPGGVFRNEIFPAVRAGSWKNFGGRDERMLLVHVDDTVRGLLAVAALPASDALGKSFVLVDDEPVTMKAFFDLTAELMQVRKPGSVPSWMAALVAGKPIVETTVRKERIASDFARLNLTLRHPTYREGLPSSLRDHSR